LRERFAVPEELLLLLRLSYGDPTADGASARGSREFGERRHFVMLGNFRHPPNADGVRWMRERIWPQVRARLPHAELHVHGAYPNREMMELTDPSVGFL